MQVAPTKKLVAAALGAACLGFGVPAMSASIVTPDGTFSPFGGFDWNSAGQAVATGAIVNGGTVITTYWGDAIAVYDTARTPFNLPTLSPPRPPGTYEYTLFATVTETINCLTANCSSAEFIATGGTYEIRYDTSADANLVTGAGITDGELLISGSIIPGVAGVFTSTGGGANGAGVFTFNGSVGFTNTAYINPELAASISTFTLQLGTNTGPGFTLATNLPGANGASGAAVPGGALRFRSDGNTDFIVRQVPEPGALALAGLGLFLAGFAGRGRRQASR